MPSTNSPGPELPLGLHIREIKTAVAVWLAYISCLVCYCLLYQKYVNLSPNVNCALGWVIGEWGIWLLIMPLAFRFLREIETQNKHRLSSYLQLATVILIVSLSFRVGVDTIKTSHNIVASTIIFFPRQLFTLGAITLIWYLILRSRSTPQKSDSPKNISLKKYPDTLLVNKGNDECLIRVNNIQCISAAGNYVEIYSNNELYLMRATMKQIEELLPPTVFLRTHRSHIINVNEIDRIKSQPSGNGAVHLRCGKMLSISKKYRSRLQKYRLPSAETVL